MNLDNNLIDQELINTISPVAPVLIIKIFFIIAFLVYMIFAFILVKQVRIKRDTVETQLGKRLSLIAIMHFIASIILLLLAIIVL